MIRKLFMLGFFLFATSQTISGQKVVLEGYVFEAGNRGFLNEAVVTVLDESSMVKAETVSDKQGFFSCELEAGRDYTLRIRKSLMFPVTESITTKTGVQEGKVFVKIKMERQPGYLFDVTLSESMWGNEDIGGGKSALTDARIEIFNNTTGKEELVLNNWQEPAFQYTFEQGSHYTVMVRKKGFITKRLEAYVNVDGCILCFEGLNNVRPEVSDVLTQGNKMGTLLANIELQKAVLNKSMRIENIYYDYNKWDIRPDAAVELDKLVGMMRDNPSIILELGSHTDARGKDEYNKDLSQKRAQSAVDYIIKKGEIPTERIKAKGYGETQIVNRCRNGVECPDPEHERNRRTEIKIIGFTEEDPTEMKSLREIVMEERIGKIVSGEVEPEVVKVDASSSATNDEEAAKINAEILADLKRQEERKKREAEEVQKRLEEAKRKMREEAKLKAMEKDSAFVGDAKPTWEEVKPSVVPDHSTKVEEKIIDNNNTLNNVKEEVKTTSEVLVNNNSTPASGVTTKAKAIASTYTGYKIEFYTAGAELPSSHQIFSQHGNIEYERKKDGSVAYLLGDFGRHKDAKHFLDSIIKPRYPNAKLIGYRRGTRISETD